MRGLAGLTRHRRNLVVAVLTLAGALTFFVAGALADAGNPILGTIKANAVDNGNGTITIYVRGQWNWLSHGSDCNLDRNGAGVGIIWNDTTEPGYTVTKGAISAGVGISTLRANDNVNQVDRMVHPSDRGNQVEGYTVGGTDYRAGQQFVDPAPAGVTATQLAAWRGGCGREPMTATASNGSNPERTGKTCANGTLACSNHPWGSWGYEKNGGLGYSHTYVKTALPDKVCVNFYDVHGKDAGLQAPNGVKEITVDDNGDNSIETNAFDVTNGANCISLVIPTVTTDIHNAAHQVVTAVEVGSTVHDFVTVSGPAAGNVTVDWFTNNTCSGAPQSNSGSVALDANGHADVTGFAKGPLGVGLYGFKAHYLGGGVNLPSDGACEPLRVVDANIQITPATATNPLNTTHTLTGHVNVNDGSGFANAPNGTLISFALVSGPGSFDGPSSCTVANGLGSCTVRIKSGTTGTTTIRASTNVTVAGVSLHRESGDGKAGDSADAAKLWAAAKITIAADATNDVVQSHTFTVTVSKDTGSGFAPAQGEHVDFTLTDSNGANHSAATGTCTNAGANTNASGQCTITFTSNSAGKVTAHASSTLAIGGLPFTVSTDGVASNSGDAVKTFVDANIQITPATAINPISTNHVLTAHVNVNNGSGGFVNAPNGTQISFTIESGPGSFTTSNPCTTSGGTGSCTITLTSATTGVTVVSAHVTLVLNGLTVTRNTNGSGVNSSAATKLWADATARTDILNASGNVVTSVAAGTIVHDKVFVAKAAGTSASVPDATGSVIFHRYATIGCTGSATNQTVALTPGSPSTAVSDGFAPVNDMSYRAEYLGDANYPARLGACEPLNVTPVLGAAIAIVKNPKSQTVAVGGTATFTITVTNSGHVTLTNVTVTDPLSPNCNRTKADIPALASMAPGAHVTYTCTRPNVRAAFDNVATATGTPPSGPNVTASDTAPVKARALTPAKKKIVKKKKPKLVSHKKPKATG
jgi:uncharacterized repeat protein (TIGR01451 family)